MVKGAFPYVFVVYLWFLVHDFVWWFVWMCMESYYEAWKVGYYHLTGNSGCGVTNFFTAQGFCWFYIGLCWVDCHSIAKFIIEFCIWPAVYCTTPGFIRTLPVFTFKRPVTSPPKMGAPEFWSRNEWKSDCCWAFAVRWLIQERGPFLGKPNTLMGGKGLGSGCFPPCTIG